VCQILGVDDEWNILKCTLHCGRVQKNSITLAILMEFFVISIFLQTKIPMVDMIILNLGKIKFGKIKFGKSKISNLHT
jgi:hypothetical protein